LASSPPSSEKEEDTVDEETIGKILVLTDRQKAEYPRMLSFQNEKIEVHSFSDANDAIQDCEVNLILLDCSVDADKGIKILEENKTNCPLIPNIFITDLNADDIVLRAFRAGARDFFRKPVNISELQNTIERLLYLRKSCREKRFPFIKPISQPLSYLLTAE
jgi:DNA-binding NtrC family response regulator